MNFFKSIILFLLVLLFWGCEEESSTKPTEKPYAISPGAMIMVANEGNFRSGNATVGLYNLITKSWLEDAFSYFSKKALGDVFQSVTFWKGKAYLVVNNSGKIEVVNPDNFEVAQTINGLTSPRFMLPVDSNKAYVTDLYANKIWILSGNPLAISGSIPAHGWTEEMVLVNDKVWVVNKSRPVIFILDPATDQLVDSLLLTAKPTTICRSSGSKVWVGTEGETAIDSGHVLWVETASKTILNNYKTLSRIAPDRFAPTLTGDTFYFVDDRPRIFFPKPGNYNIGILKDELVGKWYGIAYDPKRKMVVFSNVKDYVQKSSIFIQSSEGETELSGGKISSRFYFY